MTLTPQPGPGAQPWAQLICGSTAGCIAVYQHDVDDADNQGNDDNQGNANNKGDACKANDHHD